MHAYDSVLNYDPDTAWDEIKVKDKFLNEWFISMQAATRKGYKVHNSQRYDAEDEKLQNLFLDTKEKVHVYLCENFATYKVMPELFA